jgi:hypothetical protein
MLGRFSNVTAATILCLCALAWVSEAGATRYVYRIGGEGVADPEFPADWDVQIVKLPWDDVDGNLFGSSTLLELTDGPLRPVSLDPDVNITPQIRQNGGFIKSPDGYSFKDEATLDLLFDGDDNTAYSGGGSSFTGHGTCFGIPPEDESGGRSARRCASADRIFQRFGTSKGIQFNLGGRVPIRRIEFYPSPRYETERLIKNFMIGTNNGNDLLNGSREAAFWVGRYGLFVDFEVRHLAFTNNTSHVVLDMEDAAIQNIVFESTVGDWEIAEFKIFGAGFAPDASYTSNIIDLGETSALGNLSWSGTRPEGTGVVMSMRSGDVPDPQFYWRKTFRGDERTRFDATGKVLTRAVYDKLEGGEKAGITPNTESWEFWSPPVSYDDGSAPLAARQPRRYVQFQAELSSDRPIDAHSTLDFLEFEVTRPPLVSQALAEITPVQVNPREITRFNYMVLPQFAADDQGFDSIEILTPVRVASVDSIILSSPDTRGRDAFDVSAIAEITDSSFVIQFPEGYRRDQQSAGEPIEVIFRAPVYTYGSVFPGRVFDSEKPWEVRQRLTPGDVDPSVDSSSLTVGLSEVGAKSVGDLMLSSPVFTPNDDGFNDGLTIEYELVNLAGSVPIIVGIYDLSGHLVAEMASSRASGKFSEFWDGTDAGGGLAAPGLYIIRMEVDTDEATDTVVSTVALAY